MANLISRLLSKISGRKQRRRVTQRRLRLESMESRTLMASDLGAISGVVYTDADDDLVVDVSDPKINNATIQLYRDGGNLLFDNGAGDDVLVDTATTGVNGAYNFEDLIAGTYYVRQQAVTGQLQRTTQTVQTVVITSDQAAGIDGIAANQINIDTFDTTTQDADATGVDSVSLNTAANEAIGDERDITVVRTAGSNGLDASVNGGLLSVNSGAGTSGHAIVTYDGDDDDAAVVDNVVGLNSFDLTNGGQNLAFLFKYNAKPGSSILVTVYSSPTSFSTYSAAIDSSPVVAPALTELVIRYTDFVIGGATVADFTDVSAIQIQINVTNGSDVQADFSQLVGRANQTVNFANLNPMSIGNTVFRDENDNGIKDTGDAGINGVTVQLYTDNDTSGGFTAGDTLVDTQVTNTNGLYQFDDLFPGNYVALIPVAQFNAGQPLEGFAASAVNAGDPDTVVVDNDNNGALIAAGVATAAITLASGTEPTTDGDGADSNLTLDFGLTPQVDMVIVKTGTTTVNAGGNVTYTLQVTNNSPIAATNVQVTDNLPTGVTFVPNGTNGSTSSASWTVQANPNGELLATIGTMAAGAVQNLTVVVTVNPALAAGTVNNIATVTSDGNETLPGDNESDADTTVTRNAVLTIDKSDGTRTTVSPGDTFTYTITVTNTGLSTANNVTLSDILPAGYSFVSFTAGSNGNPQNTVVGGLDQITAGVTSLAVGATMVVGINVSVDTTILGTTITNQATADSDDSVAVNDSDTNNIVRDLDLRITKTASAATVGVGGKVTYTLTVTNDGPLDVTGVEVDDNLPNGFTLATVGNPTSVTNSPNANRDLLWVVGNLASGQASQVQIIVDVGTAVTPAANITNTATIAVDRLVGFNDIEGNNDSANVAVTVEPRYDLLITKSDSQTTVATGAQYTYTITVNNAGPNTANNVVITDVLPAGLQFVSATSNNATIGNISGQTYTAPIPTLASGETRTISMVVRVLSSATGTLVSNVASIVNTATVTADNASTQETGSRANSATDTNTLTRAVSLNVTKSAPTTAVKADTNFTYTVTAFNSGTADAPNVTFSDPLPAGVTFNSGTFTVNGTSQTGTVTLNTTTNTLEANLGTLLAGGSSTTNHATITLNVKAAATTNGVVQNTAKVANPDDVAGKTSTAPVTINPNFNLKVTKTDNATAVGIGDTLTYVIVVTNQGPSPATNISVVDTLSSRLNFVSATTGFTHNNGSTTGTIASLASGASSTITITATVKNDTPNGTVIDGNPVVISANGEDLSTQPNIADNTANDPAVTTANSLRAISGAVYVDVNRNGTRETGEPGIGGVTIILNGTVNNVAITQKTTTTAADGSYSFADLAPGTYTITQVQPADYNDGADTPGVNGAGEGRGTAAALGNDQISNIVLSNSDIIATNLGEQRRFSKRLFLSTTTDNTI